MRLIDADELIKSCQDEKGVYFSYEAAVTGNAIDKAPTVDAVKVKHATWLIHGYACPCSNCGYDLGYAGTPLEPTLAFFKYCPNCGAKMDGGTRR